MPPRQQASAAPTTRFETLSAQARTFLRARGFSDQFITALEAMLRDCAAKLNEPVKGPTQTPQEFMWSPMRPSEPVRERMPDALGDSTHYLETTHRGRKVVMPDIQSYAPNTTTTPMVYNSFASPEGQRFMRRYFMNGWLRRDPASGEWTLTLPPRTVPRRIARR